MTDNEETRTTTRRDFLGSILMWSSLAAASVVIGIEGLLFLLPKKLQPSTRRIFAGSIDDYEVGSTQSFYDLRDSEILVKREPSGFKAFSTVCPHLGCQVFWEAESNRFFCPCHRGIFDENGIATEGPPKDGGQNLPEIPVTVDSDSGVVYLEVKDVQGRDT